jgi:hypothetical protein
LAVVEDYMLSVVFVIHVVDALFVSDVHPGEESRSRQEYGNVLEVLIPHVLVPSKGGGEAIDQVWRALLELLFPGYQFQLRTNGLRDVHDKWVDFWGCLNSAFGLH